MVAKPEKVGAPASTTERNRPSASSERCIRDRVTVLGGRLPEYQVVYDPNKLKLAGVDLSLSLIHI